MLNPRNLANGQEQHETFKSSVTRKKAVQYDYSKHDQILPHAKTTGTRDVPREAGQHESI